MNIRFIGRVAIVAAALALLVGCQENGSDSKQENPLKPMQADPTSLPSLGAGWELVPHATYTASQTTTQVFIKAIGENPTGGYETKLVQSPVRIWPPQFRLARKKPEGMVIQMILPFEVSTSFNAKDAILSVTVMDGEGLHRVPVDQARD